MSWIHGSKGRVKETFFTRVPKGLVFRGTSMRFRREGRFCVVVYRKRRTDLFCPRSTVIVRCQWTVESCNSDSVNGCCSPMCTDGPGFYVVITEDRCHDGTNKFSREYSYKCIERFLYDETTQWGVNKTTHISFSKEKVPKRRT